MAVWQGGGGDQETKFKGSREAFILDSVIIKACEVAFTSFRASLRDYISCSNLSALSRFFVSNNFVPFISVSEF